MSAQLLARCAIGSAAFGAGAAAVVILALASGPTLEAKLGVLGVELSLSIGDAQPAAAPAYLEASMLRRSPDNRVSGVELRVAKSTGLWASAAVPATDGPVSRVAAPVLATPTCDQNA